MALADRITEVDRRIAAACERSGRKREDVRVVAVTKYVSAAAARAVVEQGITQLGENRWPASEEKWNLLRGQASFHFIGSLQTKKVREVVGRFDYIHSLDRLSLAEEIEKRASALGIVVPCFVQVNVSGEESKHGLSPNEAADFAAAIRPLRHIRPIGLMTMAPIELEAEEARPVFRELRLLKDKLNAGGVFGNELAELSMGMSGDFEVAIEEGATWVRLGTVLVGKEEEEA
ncbi:YggS family pyridoxal phosphate-dependent enzyme [Cohnella fermenti]|uniref:Pyridoxal phosphate homeostasis protein n=1 Tax=Cohnella fermenti TaxID=2565925 RepID=A0A4S4BLE3_9BACL|nr:YggS family pyridoxal phosphate-dependent enzyme [Cohnella fermenti]THF75580.1 YggS family pyridoxal phosphate-dependent enzyme [Cohnella fermenti]